MKRLEFSCAVRLTYTSLSAKGSNIIQFNFRLSHFNVIHMFVLICILCEHSTSIFPILSQINPVRSLSKYFFKKHFNIIFMLTPTSLKFSLLFGIPTKASHEFLISLNAKYLFARLASISEIQKMDVLFMHFSNTSY